MKIFAVILKLVVLVTAMKNVAIFFDQEESLATALVTIILECYVPRSNTIFVTKGTSKRLDRPYATILSRICATIDKTSAIAIYITEIRLQKDCYNAHFTHNVIVVDSYQSFR